MCIHALCTGTGAVPAFGTTAVPAISSFLHAASLKNEAHASYVRKSALSHASARKARADCVKIFGYPMLEQC